MPRCKPKRFHRNRKFQVARRKRKRDNLITGNPRNRRKREKKKKEIKNE